MLDDRARTESTNHILGGLGMQVGVSLATQVVVNIFQKMLGNSYSEANFKRYTELKRVYAQILSRDEPHFWKLDDKKRPTFQIGNYKWSDYVRELSEGKESTGNYSSQSSSIAKYISTYLTERRKRWFGSGKPGDVLELFMSEWLHFALNELPTYKFDEASINKIKARMAYLVKIKKHEDLFKFGFVKRNKNKFDTMESIRQELLDCERRAKKQASRECAREKFKIFRDSTTDLLGACVNSIYYARATAVYNEPLNLRSFVDSDNIFLTKNAKEHYPKVKSTHTGAMLYEVILLSGLESFGVSSLAEAGSFKGDYFNENFSPKSVDWSSKKVDLPIWFGKKEALRYLTETQQMAECLLRIAKLKGLVEDVYDLTGQLGDLWAYGDKRGKLSLEGLLFLLEKELGLFYDRYEKLYQYQDTLKEAYVIKNSINRNDAANQNFKFVDDMEKEVGNFYGRLTAAITDLKRKLGEFSEEEVKRIDDRKKLFYQTVVGHVKQYYPDDYHRFQLLEQPLSQEEAVAAFGLDGPLMDHARLREKVSINLLEKCFPGEKFSPWRKKYFNRHKNEYLDLAKLMQQFEEQLNENSSFNKIAELAKALQDQLEQMRFKALAERPVWRLGWFFLSVGWPFKQGINRNINLLLDEFALLSADIKRSVEEGGVKKEEGKQGAGLKIELLSLPKTQKQERAVFHYRNNKSTIFNKKQKLADSILEEKQCGNSYQR